jgi:hypothetical protein
MTILLDYSSARPSHQAMKQFGTAGVIRYLCSDLANPKHLTRDEAQALRADGFWVGLVWENQAKRALDGFAAGRLDAFSAASQAHALGVPAGCPIAYAVDDESITAGAATPYFKGVLSAQSPYPVMVYGSFSVVEGIMPLGVPYGWQTVAWSGGRRSSQAHLFQTNEASVPGTDKNVLLKPVPFWGAPVPRPQPHPDPHPAPHPQPTPTPKGKRMDLYQKLGKPEVYQALGSHLEHITAEAFAARHLDRKAVQELPANHPIWKLPITPDAAVSA